MEIRRTRLTMFTGACLALALAVMTGCNSEPAEPPVEGAAPVTGTVTMDDNPVAMASIMFYPQEGGEVAQGLTDAAGKYELTTRGTKGAKAGKYKVVISQMSKNGQPMAPDVEKSPMDLLVEGATEALPTAYSDMVGSKLTATVPDGGGTIDFKLNAQGTVPAQ